MAGERSSGSPSQLGRGSRSGHSGRVSRATLNQTLIKLQIVDPNEAQTHPVQLHGKLVAWQMDGWRKGKGRTEGATQSKRWGPIVHSTFLCIEQDGKRYTQTLFTIKSTTQKQLVVLTSDESMHESQMPTVRAMLQPIVDGTAHGRRACTPWRGG